MTASIHPAGSQNYGTPIEELERASAHILDKIAEVVIDAHTNLIKVTYHSLVGKLRLFCSYFSYLDPVIFRFNISISVLHLNKFRLTSKNDRFLDSCFVVMWLFSSILVPGELFIYYLRYVLTGSSVSNPYFRFSFR